MSSSDPSGNHGHKSHHHHHHNHHHPKFLMVAGGGNSTASETHISDGEVKEMLKRENDSLRSEISELKKELDELQDSFRTKDAEEFQRIQVELEMANKKCRVLQYRLMRIEKRNDELTEEKTRLEECLAIAQEQIFKVEELEDELVIAKEVSVRLHKELEESEELRTAGDKLNESLKQQYEEVKEHIQNEKQNNDNNNTYSDCNDHRLFCDLYDSLYREYALNEKLSKQSQKLKVLENKHGANRSEVDQKLALMHGYVCRLREALEEKDGVIARLSEKLNEGVAKTAAADDDSSRIDDGDNDDDGRRHAIRTNLATSQSTPDLIQSSSSPSPKRNQNSRLLLWRSATSSTLAHQQSTTLMPSHGLTDAATQSDQSSFNNTKFDGKVNGIVEEKKIDDQNSSVSSNQQDQVLEIKQLRTQIRKQAEEIENMRKCFNDYLKLKQELEASLQEAGELIVSRDSIIEKFREDNAKMRQQFTNEHKRLVEQIKKLDDELQICHREKIDVERKHAEQLMELKHLEDSYHNLGQKLNDEVSELMKQIAQLNEDKDKLECSFNRLRESKKKYHQLTSETNDEKEVSPANGVDNIINQVPDQKVPLAHVEKVRPISSSATNDEERVPAEAKCSEQHSVNKQKSGIPQPTKLIGSNNSSSGQISRSFYNGKQHSPSSSSPESSMSQSVPSSNLGGISSAKMAANQQQRSRAINRWISSAAETKLLSKSTALNARPNAVEPSPTIKPQSIFTKIKYHRRSKSKANQQQQQQQPTIATITDNTAENAAPAMSNIPKLVTKQLAVIPEKKRRSVGSNPQSISSKIPNAKPIRLQQQQQQQPHNSSQQQQQPTETQIPSSSKPSSCRSDDLRQDEATDNNSSSKQLGSTRSLETTVKDVDSLLSRVTSTARPLMIDS